MQDVIDIEVTPLSAACGAKIKGVDLTRPVSESAVRAIKQAWARHLVLLFRGQTLSQDDQLRFASISARWATASARPRRSEIALKASSRQPEGPARLQHHDRRQAERGGRGTRAQ